MNRALALASLWAIAACTSAAPKEPLKPAVVERQFGAKPTLAGEAVAVSEVLANPQPYLNKTIKCQGAVARVCEAAGCWLELRTDLNATEGLRVPMAGHSFFIPKDVVGHPAVIEGTLAARDLPQAELDHLQGEGLKAIGPLYLAATSVVIR